MRNQFLRVPGVRPHSGTCCAITIRMGSNEEKANDMTAACPLAFGETGVKERVRRVLSYKKPAFRVMIAALIVCAAASVCLPTNQSGVALDRVEGKSLRGLYDDISAIEFEYSDGESLSQVRTVAAYAHNTLLLRDKRRRYPCDHHHIPFVKYPRHARRSETDK